MVETCDKYLPHSTGLVPHTMPRPKEPLHLLADCTQRRRLQELQQVVTKELAAPYTAKYLPDTGQIVLAPETRVVVTVQPEPTMEVRLIMAAWRIRLLHLSRTESRYLVRSMTYGVVWDQVYGMLWQLALPEARAFTAYTGDDTAIHGAACYLANRMGHLYKCQPPPPLDIMQPGDRRLHWSPIAVDGTSRHEASYGHCTLGGSASPNQLSSWWLLGGSEKWETLYVAAREMDFDDELRKAATVSFKDTGGNDGHSFFFLCADGKAKVLTAGCKNWKAESPGATVCWVCMRNRAMCLATFGTASAIDGNWEGAVAIGAIYGRFRGGGGVISGVLTQSGRFFGRFRNFGPRPVWTLLKSWSPPFSDMENSKIKVSWPNKTVVGLSEVPNTGDFQEFCC